MSSKFHEFKPLRFGTSGLRDTVENMSDMECYINTRGFIAYLREAGEFGPGSIVAIGGDRRPSTPRIKRAVAAAIRDMNGNIDEQGLTSTPALTYYAMQRGISSIMVTGSHIPAGRNGIKFNKKAGEVLKSDEKGILACVAEEREKIYKMPCTESLFNDQTGMFKRESAESAGSLIRNAEYSGGSVREYIARYRNVFQPNSLLSKTKLFFYQHSAVARDFGVEIFEALGAEVIAPDEEIEINYLNEEGKRELETTLLRSPAFIAVDTESVSNRTLSIFKKMMDLHELDIGVTVDGDSDRPLLVYRDYRKGKPTEEIEYITGDILGLLTVLALENMGVEINAVAVPVSANDAILKVLGDKKVEVTQTKIGSPYVVAAMIASLESHRRPQYPVWNVLSWESNGGFLTGNDIEIKGKVLRALPTRDPFLPLISVLLMAETNGVPISDLITQLPGRYTHAERKRNFSAEKSRAIIHYMSPEQEPGLKQIDFLGNGKAIVSYIDGRTKEFGTGSEFHNLRERVKQFFKKDDGFTDISGLNYIDGVRISFSNGDISHFRPSGNAPEFRNYAIADSPQRSKAIVETGLNKIIPEMDNILKL